MAEARNFYDVVVVGAGLGALAAAALVARRGFRVCVVPDGELPPTYEHQGVRLWREPSTHPAMHAPVFARISEELALGPALRRHTRAATPALQVVLPEHRFELGNNVDALRAEFEREVPEVRQGAEEFHARLRELTARSERWLGAEVHWPPDGFFERRAARKAHEAQGDTEDFVSLLASFAQGHPVRTALEHTAELWSRVDPLSLAAEQYARAYGLALRGSLTFLDGRETLHGVLSEKLAQLGGEVRARDRVARLEVRRGRVQGVWLDTTDELLGCRWVLTSRPAATALRLCDSEPDDALSQRLLACEPVAWRYTVNLVLRAQGLPVGLGERVVYAPATHALGPLWLERHAQSDPERVVLTATTAVPRAQGAGGLRALVRRALGELIPWLDEHTLWVDCPHDGLPLEDLARGERVTLPERWKGEAEPAAPVYGADREGFAGVCALPASLGAQGLLRVGSDVVQGLGEEGELLAAWSAAQRVAAAEPGRERLRKEVWGRAGGAPKS